MFSKNMVTIIFIPFLYYFMWETQVKKVNLLNIFDYLVLIFLILIFSNNKCV